MESISDPCRPAPFNSRSPISQFCPLFRSIFQEPEPELPVDLAMEGKYMGPFPLGKQSSFAPDHSDGREEDGLEVLEGIDADIRLMYFTNERDVGGILELLRTKLHVAACLGRTDVVELLLRNGVKVDPEDRWKSTICPVCMARVGTDMVYKHFLGDPPTLFLLLQPLILFCHH